MSQSKKMSLVETLLSVLIGYFVALLVQIITFPMFDLEVSFEQNLLIGVIFTGASIIRGYFVRRFFNWIDVRYNIRRENK